MCKHSDDELTSYYALWDYRYITKYYTVAECEKERETTFIFHDETSEVKASGKKKSFLVDNYYKVLTCL